MTGASIFSPFEGEASGRTEEDAQERCLSKYIKGAF